MNYFRSEIKIGILVFVSFSLLLFFVLSIGTFQLFQDTKDFFVYFNFASGLEINAPVRYAGVEIGKVQDIRIVNRDERRQGVSERVEVVLRVLERVELSKHIKATVNTLGLLGEKYVELSPVSGRFDNEDVLEQNDYIIGEDPIQIKELMEIGKSIISKLDHTMGAIDTVVGDEETQRAVRNVVLGAGNVIKNLEGFTGNLNGIMKKHRPKVEDIIQNIDKATIRLENLMHQADGMVKENRTDIKTIISNLKDTSKYAKAFAKKIKRSPSSLVWKSRSERKKEIEEKKQKIDENKEVVTNKGRVVSRSIFRHKRSVI